MQEPTASKYPQEYDDSSTLFAALQNHTTLTVKKYVDVEMNFVVVNEDASAIVPPLYVTFEGGEIWLVDAVSQNGLGEWMLEISGASQRAIHGSPIQPHVVNEKIFVGLLSQPVIMLKRALVAAQKYRFLVSTEAGRALITPQLGERILCVDSKKIYACIVAGAWTWANRAKHSFLTDLGADDHPQYATEPEFLIEHPGGHIADGDNHTHTVTAAVKAIRATTLASLGDPVTEGDVCFVTDVGGGTLFVSFDGVEWEPHSGIPSGAIAMFGGACPPGWSRYTQLDGKFPRGAATAGGTGGASSHSHTYTGIHQHTHSVAQQALSVTSAGAHTHPVKTKTSAGGGVNALARYGGNSTWNTQSAGAHSHTVTIPSRSTDSTGASPATTASASVLPPYQEVLFCKKD